MLESNVSAIQLATEWRSIILFFDMECDLEGAWYSVSAVCTEAGPVLASYATHVVRLRERP